MSGHRWELGASVEQPLRTLQGALDLSKKRLAAGIHTAVCGLGWTVDMVVQYQGGTSRGRELSQQILSHIALPCLADSPLPGIPRRN